MKTNTYIIHYGMYYGADKYKSGKMKIKNCLSEAHAKVKLEKFLIKKTEGFKNMVVYACTLDDLGFFDFMKGYM